MVKFKITILLGLLIAYSLLMISMHLQCLDNYDYIYSMNYQLFHGLSIITLLSILYSSEIISFPLIVLSFVSSILIIYQMIFDVNKNSKEYIIKSILGILGIILLVILALITKIYHY